MRRHYQDGGYSVDLYDLRMQVLRDSPIDADTELYRAEARACGGPVLELASGTGRVTLAIAQAGVRITGLERSVHMLRVARRKARELAPDAAIEFVRGDMAGFDLHRRFRLVIIPFRAFQHLITPEDQRRCLDCIRRHLMPRGKLIVHLFDPRLEYCLPESHLAPVEREAVRHPVTGRRVVVRVADRRNQPLTQTFTETWTWSELDDRGRTVRTERDRLSLRWTYRWEMQYLLELAGYHVEACFGDFRRGRLRYGGEQVWVARR